MSLLARRPIWVLWILAGAVVLAETVAMVFFGNDAARPAPWVVLSDAAFLGACVVPIVYFLVIRPSRSQVEALEAEVARRAHAESDLEAERSLDKLLIDSLPHPAWLIGRDRRVLLQNRTGAELRSEGGELCWQGFPSRAGTDVGSDRCSFCKADEAFSRGETLSATVELRGRVWDAYWVPVDTRTGTYLHYAVDVTERLRAEDEERRAREAAEAANQAKSIFLAMMSHEIRTPMNGVIGMIDLALDTELSKEQEEYLGLARSSAEALLRVIGDVLDFSKAEAGKMEFERLPFDLRATVEGAVGTLAYLARDKGVELRVEWEPGLASACVGDAGRLRQVLLNLLSNALKFTETGEVIVGVSREAAETPAPGNRVVRFRVRDSGPGIPPDKLDRLFKSFSQLDALTTRRHGGTGLGLAISKQIVEQMGGRIWVESREGEGSTFSFCLPLGPDGGTEEARPSETAPPTEALGRDPARRLRVLVAEDNPVNQRLATLLMEKRGHAAVAVSNGLEALNALSAGRFDLVLMDVQMPVLGGLDATRALRARENGGPRTPVIGLTALAMKSDREACLRAGMDECVVKPLNAPVLLEAIDRVLGAPTKDSPGSAADLEDLLEALGGDESALRELVDHFLGESRNRICSLREAVAAGDHAEVGRIAHAVKGSASVFRARTTVEAAERLESLASSGSAASPEELVDLLERELRRLEAHLLSRSPRRPGTDASPPILHAP